MVGMKTDLAPRTFRGVDRACSGSGGGGVTHGTTTTTASAVPTAVGSPWTTTATHGRTDRGIGAWLAIRVMTTTKLMTKQLGVEIHRSDGLNTSVVGLNPPTGVDRQHESREAQSLYSSALQLACTLRLEFVGCTT
jgi:hypothetical protein